MKKSKLLLLISLLLLSSCNNNTNREPNENEIKDASNRIIQIPDDSIEDRIASVYAVASPFFLALQISDCVVAVNTKKAFYKNNDAGLARAGNCGNGDVDLEKLASYHPTVFIHRSNDSKTVKAVEKLGIDVITIKVENIDDVKYTLRNLGKYFNVSERAEEVCSWIDEQFSYIDNIVSLIPESERKTALLMGSSEGRIAGSDMLQNWMIEKAGGKTLVTEYKDHSWVNVGVERVLEYDPDFLFLTSSSVLNYSAYDLYHSSVYSETKAVKNENIYQIPAINDSWDLPGLSPVLGTLYMLRCMYPSYISLNELNTKIDEYYTLMFNKTFSESQLGYEIK